MGVYKKIAKSKLSLLFCPQNPIKKGSCGYLSYLSQVSDRSLLTDSGTPRSGSGCRSIRTFDPCRRILGFSPDPSAGKKNAVEYMNPPENSGEHPAPLLNYLKSA